MTENRRQMTEFLDCGLRIVCIPPRTSQPATRNPTPTRHRKSRIENRASGIENPTAGFTLLEVMVAMSIMAIVLVSVYRMHSQTLTMNTATRFYTQAPLLARGKLAQLEASSSELIAGDSGDFGEGFPGYRWNVTVEEITSEALGEAAKDLKRIDFMVSFNDNEYVYNVRAYRLMRE